MRCEEVRRAVDTYLDEELTVLESLGVEDHLRDCEPCRRVMESEATLHSLLAADALQDDPPARLRARILALIAAEASMSEAARRQGRSAHWPRLMVRLSGVATVVLMMVVAPGTRGPADHPLGGDLVREHDRSLASGDASLGLITADVGRAERWLEDRLRVPITIPPAAGPGTSLMGARVSTVANRPTGHLVYGGEGRRVSLFIVPRLTLPPLEGNEHEVEGIDVYTTAAGGLQLGWWNHGGDLYLAATNAGDGDLIGFATLCVRARRSDMPEGGRGPREGNLRREDSPGRRGP